MIGVFDSGIGGLSVLKALRNDLPLEDFVYLADSGHAPYGERDTAHVLARSSAVAAYLVGQNVSALVIACNTATAAAVALLRSEYPGLPIVGVEPALKPAVALSRTGRIGLLATRSTLESVRFKTLLDAQAGLATFVLQACDGLADTIERSAATGDATEIIAACARITRAMGPFGSKNGEIDTLVLGCTHYPFAAIQLHALLGPEVYLVDNAEAVARQTRRLLAPIQTKQVDTAVLEPGRIRLFSTGHAHALEAAASRWLDLDTAATLLSL